MVFTLITLLLTSIAFPKQSASLSFFRWIKRLSPHCETSLKWHGPQKSFYSPVADNVKALNLAVDQEVCVWGIGTPLKWLLPQNFIIPFAMESIHIVHLSVGVCRSRDCEFAGSFYMAFSNSTFVLYNPVKDSCFLYILWSDSLKNFDDVIAFNF